MDEDLDVFDGEGEDNFERGEGDMGEVGYKDVEIREQDRF
jgi:hypothetical protein